MISPLGVGMMAPDLPGTGAVMEMDSSGFAVIVTCSKGAPDPERARPAGSVLEGIEVGGRRCLLDDVGKYAGLTEKDQSAD